MAKIVVYSAKEFEKAVSRLARPQTHVIVTDEIGNIVAVPRTTSRHWHYIQYSSTDEGEIEKLVKFVEGKGFEVIVGYVQEVPG